jgi:hypothetical protein
MDEPLLRRSRPSLERAAARSIRCYGLTILPFTLVSGDQLPRRRARGPRPQPETNAPRSSGDPESIAYTCAGTDGRLGRGRGPDHRGRRWLIAASGLGDRLRAGEIAVARPWKPQGAAPLAGAPSGPACGISPWSPHQRPTGLPRPRPIGYLPSGRRTPPPGTLRIDLADEEDPILRREESHFWGPSRVPLVANALITAMQPVTGHQILGESPTVST